MLYIYIHLEVQQKRRSRREPKPLKCYSYLEPNANIKVART